MTFQYLTRTGPTREVCTDIVLAPFRVRWWKFVRCCHFDKLSATLVAFIKLIHILGLVTPWRTREVIFLFWENLVLSASFYKFARPFWDTVIYLFTIPIRCLTGINHNQLILIAEKEWLKCFRQHCSVN